MPAASSVSLVAALRQHHLLEPAQLQELGRFQTRFADPHQLTQELLQRGWLTAHQATLLLAGRGNDLVLGPYTVLDRLGEGGNGEVFKARHRTMQRIVSLKIVRKELLADPDVVGRFHREVEVLSQIAHPNIVHAYDAGPIGASLGLAMEYVAGVDLERLVERSGKLKANQAIDYIRQAARGLQHAQERGLIHRDIKPANLLVTQAQGPKSKVDGASSQSQSRQSTGGDKKGTGLGTSEFGLLRILDLGLARLQQPVQGSQTGNLTVLGDSGMAYDKRGTTLPGWLNDGSWQLTAELFAVTDGDPNTSPMKVFAKQFPPGPVSLGGNRQEPAKGAGSNYVVIIKPL